MTVAVWAVIVILFFHWLSDFVFQPNEMSINKSKNWGVLAHHSLRITLGYFYAAMIVLAIDSKIGWLHGSPHWSIVAWEFAGINGAAHFFIDAVTSRITSRLWKQEKVHDFFVTIGFDQFLHLTIAVITLGWLL